MDDKTVEKLKEVLQKTPFEFNRAYLNEWESHAAVDAAREEKEIFVVARDYHAARLYAQLHNIEKKRFKYVSHESGLYGRSNIEIHLVTTCSEHERYTEIMHYIKVLVQSGRATVKEVTW